MVSEARKQSMAWMETDYSKHTYFRWKVKWRLEHLGALGTMNETAPLSSWGLKAETAWKTKTTMSLIRLYTAISYTSSSTFADKVLGVLPFMLTGTSSELDELRKPALYMEVLFSAPARVSSWRSSPNGDAILKWSGFCKHQNNNTNYCHVAIV